MNPQAAIRLSRSQFLTPLGRTHMTREEMREKIADIFAKAEYGFPFREIIGHSRTRMLNSADAAIAIIRGETLEESARVAETPVETMCCNNPLWNGNPEDQPECCGKPEYRWGDPGEIAAAIRALKDKP